VDVVRRRAGWSPRVTRPFGAVGGVQTSYRTLEGVQEALKQMNIPRVESTEAEDDLPKDVYSKVPDMTKGQYLYLFFPGAWGVFPLITWTLRSIVMRPFVI